MKLLCTCEILPTEFFLYNNYISYVVVNVRTSIIPGICRYIRLRSVYLYLLFSFFTRMCIGVEIEYVIDAKGYLPPYNIRLVQSMHQN